MTLSEELTWRGLVNQTTFKDLSQLDSAPITFYFGVDPSADSMTIGNLAAAMLVKIFMKHGHHAVLLVGGATGLIGDPDGKSQERQLKSIEEIEHNTQAIIKQYHQVFGESELQMVNNYDWFKDWGYLDFLREVGKHIPMRQMLAREFVQSRLGEAGSGISYAEFSYVLIQAYDFLHLYEKHAVTLQVCGSDQWGNSIAGVDLIRRKTGGEAHVYSIPLIVNETTGEKFGKSQEGAIWLDSHKTTPTAFYQFWINVGDEGVESYLRIFTELDKETIERIMNDHHQNPGKRLAQMSLADAVTRLVHDDTQADIAQAVTAVLTGTVNLNEVSDEHLMQALRSEVSRVTAEETSEIAQVLVDASLASSKTEARQLLTAHAISINGQKVDRQHLESTDFQNGRLLLRRGKAFKDSALVELQ